MRLHDIPAVKSDLFVCSPSVNRFCGLLVFMAFYVQALIIVTYKEVFGLNFRLCHLV